MAIGLTRQEQWALAGVVGVIFAGLAYDAWKHHAAGEVHVAGQGYWKEVAAVDAGPRTPPAIGTQVPRAGNVTHAAATASTDASTSPTRAGPGAAGGLDLNRATQEELERLPMIGPVRARAILDARRRMGGFASVEDLLSVPGIGAKTLETLRPLVTVGPGGDTPTSATPSPVRATPAPTIHAAPTPMPTGTVSPAPGSLPSPSLQVNLNRAGERELETIPGIGPVLARRIVEDRARRGPFRRPEDLIRVQGIGPTTFQKMRPWISVGEPSSSAPSE